MQSMRDAMAGVFGEQEWAVWKHARLFEVVADLDARFRPLKVAGQPGDLFSPETTSAALKKTRGGGGDVLDLDIAKQYGDWLQSATYSESENSSRLQALLWALRTAEGFRRQYPDDEAIGGALGTLATFVAAHYRAVDAPTNELEARDYADRHCRNYRAMPREWREL